MAKTKYYVSLLLIALSLFFVGEVHNILVGYQLEDFEKSDYKIGVKISKDESPEEFDEIINMLKTACENNNIGLFISQFETNNNLEETEHFYCTPTAVEYVENALDGHFRYESVLAGTTNYKIDSLDNIKVIESRLTVSFCGEKDSIDNARSYIRQHFKQVPNYGTAGEDTYLFIKYGSIFLAVILIGIFNLFDINLKRKEYVVKCIYGQGRLWLIAKYFFVDILIYLAEICTAFCVISKINSLGYCLKDVVIFTLILTFVIILSYIPLLVIKPISTIKGQESIKKMLTAGRLTKLFVSVLIVCSIAIFATLVADSKTYIKTADFFNQNSDYSYIFMRTKDEDESFFIKDENYADLNYKIAYEYYDVCQPILLENKSYSVYEGENDGANGYFVFANSNAMNYLKSMISELDNVEISKDYVIIMSEKVYTQKVLELTLEEINCRYKDYMHENKVHYTGENVQVIVTKEDYEVFACDNEKTSEIGIFKNQPVVISTINENLSDQTPEELNLGTQKYYMYKMTEDIKNEIIKNYDLGEFVQTNCKEQFDYYWRMNRLGIVYFGAFTVISIILEIVMLSFIVKNEFDLNKEEFCLKKVMGYSMFSRYGQLIFETLFLSGISFLASIILLGKLLSTVTFKIAIGVCVVLLAMEFVVILIYVAKLERNKVSKILKGGAL